MSRPSLGSDDPPDPGGARSDGAAVESAFGPDGERSASRPVVGLVAVLVALLAAGAAGAGGGVAAQEPSVTEVFFSVDVPAAGGGSGGDAVVDARYGVAVRAGTDTVRLRTIVFADARPSRVEAWVHGERASLSPGGTRGRDLTFLLEIPRTVPRDRRLVVRLRYGVARPGAVDGDRFDVVVPLILPEAPPTAASERLFTGQIRLPAGWTVVEAFPTVRRTVRADAGGATRTHGFDLQAVPAMLRWRGRIGEPTGVSVTRTVDLATLGAFLLFVIVGYGWLRREGRDHG